MTETPQGNMKIIPAYMQRFVEGIGAHPLFTEALCKGFEADFKTQTGRDWPSAALILPHQPEGFTINTTRLVNNC